jgi:hypothetical protein
MSWCSFIKDNALRYDLRQGSFSGAWDTLIPSCGDSVRGGDEWRANCGSCESRNDCRWCAVYAYLETGRYSAPIPHLCAVAKEARKFRKNWQRNHRRCLSVFGDHIGSDVEDIFIEWSQNFDQLSYKLSFDRVRSGIQTKNYPQFDFTYSGEIGYQIEPNTKITLKYAYENIINVGNVQNYNQRNQFLGVEYAIYF